MLAEPNLKDLENSAQIFNALSDIPGDIEDVDQLLEVIFFFFTIFKHSKFALKFLQLFKL